MILCLSMLLVRALFAVDAGSRVQAVRIETPPAIDGLLDDIAWTQASPAADFATLEPVNQHTARLQTRVWFAYDEIALYIAAEMKAAGQDSVFRQLGARDDDGVAADWFGIWISPYNDKANDIVFEVTAAGVQIDFKSGPNYEDSSWDPVWESAVHVHNRGWTTEFAIPFSQVRFPARDIQVWGVNMARGVQATREVFTWCYVEKDHPNWSEFEGELHGIKDIEMPLRLSLTPYAAATLSHFPFDEPGKSNWSRSIRGGMDLKYGINESFTLDLTLIPDFGEVQSDNVVLNFTPFEIQYDERRPFFTEGTDLLSKAGSFYSRRVGARPIRYWDVEDQVVDDSLIIENPEESQMINATKITGQTQDGLGLALFNAMTAPMYARIIDSTGVERDYMTAPFTNFNRVVVNKNLGSGSEIGISNSHVFRGTDTEENDLANDFRDANVTGIGSRLAFQESKYVVAANGAYSHIYQGDSTIAGYAWGLDLSERDGALRAGAGINVESDTYDPNDLGFMFSNNEFTQFGWIELIQHEPRGHLMSARAELMILNTSLFEPREFVESSLEGNWNITFRNYLSHGGVLYLRPAPEHDFYEARTDDQVFLIPPRGHVHVWFSTNYNRPFSFDFWVGSDTRDERGQLWYGGGYTPRWRVSDRLFMYLDGEIHKTEKEHGFADFDAADQPVFGRRSRKEITHVLSARYTASNTLSTHIRLRHYWSQVVYDRFFDILPDGSLTQRSYGEDLNGKFNAFNVDAVLVWRFAPGSELNLIWKNAIVEELDGVQEHHHIGNVRADYLHDLGHVLDQEQSNSISIKLLYYIDYWELRNRLR